MKKTLLASALAMTLCLPVYAEQQFTNDTRHAAEFPVFGDEDQERANLGIYMPGKSGKISKNALRPEITDVNDPNYVPPLEHTKKRIDSKQQPIPVKLSGDHVEFENSTGDFTAVGKVLVKQGGESLSTNYAFGNMKTGDIYLLEGGTLMEPGNRTEGKWVHYNFNNKTGEIKNVEGRGLKDVYKAPHAVILPDKLVIDQGGTSSRCFAKEHVPCMHIKAKTFEFYPKEKMIAHDVKVYIKGKHIYSRKLWINDFTKEKETFIRPAIGWNGHDNGFYARVDVKQPISEKDIVHVSLPKYSRVDFKPTVSVSHHERNWNLKYFTGWDEDDDYWYLKQNNWKLEYKPHHFIKGIPLTVSGSFEYGLWRKWNPDNDNTIYFRDPKNWRKITGSQSWHREYKYYINHDPIKIFGPDTTLHLTFGRKWVHESLTEETKITNMYYTILRQKIDSNKNIWAGYMREKKTSTLFDLGQSDMERELRVGAQWTPTKNDALSVVHRYDVGQNRPNMLNNRFNPNVPHTRKYKTTYNWYHRFCCWALQMSYECDWHKDKRKLMFNYYLYNW